MSEYIGSSVQEIEAGAGAPMLAGVLEKLKDLDANRIAKNDDIVMRKAVLGLLAVVADLEARVTSIEQAQPASRSA
jgi:hypothetical protein